MADVPSTHIEVIDGVTNVILTEPSTDSIVHVTTDIGSNVSRFRTRVRNQPIEVLAAPDSMATLRERSTRFGSAILFPFPGRIKGGRFTFQGRDIQLPTDGRDGNAIHGVLRNRPWRIASTTADADGASVVCEIDTVSANVPESEWPFPFTMRLTISLRGGVLRTDIETTNTGSTPMPMGLGFHPYFPTPLGPKGKPEECWIRVEATEEWEQSQATLPTGKVTPLADDDGNRVGVPLARVPFHATTPDGSIRNILFRRPTSGPSDGPGGVVAELRDGVNGVLMTLAASAGFGHLVVFVPANQPMISYEPHTCVPNAFNLANESDLPTGMIALAPGETWRGWYTIDARPLGAP